MTMTHYMELLASNQPWNLIVFMAIPVILAEFIAVTELYLLFSRNLEGKIAVLNRWASVLVGVYFTGIFVYLLKTAVVPLSLGGGWRGLADVVAVGFYLAGIVPLGAMSLLGLGLIAKNKSKEEKLRLHAIMVAVFLVVAHIAMIFGMLNPEVLGYVAPVVNHMGM